MKSERAKQHIDNDTIEFRNGDRMVDASTAYIAVEIAEEEMAEEALAAATMIFWERNNLKAGSVMKKKLPLFAQKLRDE